MNNKTVYLFHEGTSGGLDQTVLDAIRRDTNKNVIPQPFGGVGGHSRYLDGFGDYAKSLGTELAVIGFRDRDFHFPVPETPRLTKTEKSAYVYAGYRTTLENYLLDAEMFFNFTKNEMRTSIFDDVKSAKTLFDESAQDILLFQAARYALGSIRNDKARQETNFRNYEEEAKSKNKGKFCFFSSENLPPSLAEADCRKESHIVIETFQNEAANYSKDRFNEEFEQALTKFREPSFMEQSAYLVWFQGKTLQTALKRRLPKGFPMGLYNKYAATNFDYTKHPDLVELRDIIDNL